MSCTVQGILTVFEICTLEMWPNLMIAAVDSQNEVDLGPKRNAREWVVVYFMTCVVRHLTPHAARLISEVHCWLRSRRIGSALGDRERPLMRHTTQTLHLCSPRYRQQSS